MKKSRKGYTMVLAITVISVVLTLVSLASAMAFTNFTLTTNLKKDSKLKQSAEAGLERGQALLREYITDNPDYLDPNSSIIYNPTVPTFYTDSGVQVDVSFASNTNVDDKLTKRILDEVVITSTASYNNEKITLTNTIDAKGIYDKYYDLMFKGCISSLDTASDIDTTYTNLNVNGNIYLQGNNIQFKPENTNGITNDFTMNSGSITLNGTNIDTNVHYAYDNSSPKKEIGIYYNSNVSTFNSPSGSAWNGDSIFKELPLLNVKSGGDSGADPVVNVYNSDLSHDNQKNIDSGDLQIKNSLSSTFTSNKKTLATIKVDKIDGSGTPCPINLEYLVNGIDGSMTSGIYNDIITHLEGEGYSEAAAKDAYGTMYKVLLVDGDLYIPKDEGYTLNYNNYIIYCTGTVNFKDDAHFYNSSITANNYHFPGSHHTIEVNGVNTQSSGTHDVNGMNLQQFTTDDTANINIYLLKNLKGYGDYIRFKTISLTESKKLN